MTMMRVSDRGRVEIASHEAIVLSPYKDSVGMWTIFIGHTANAGEPNPAKMKKGHVYSLEMAMEVFERDLRKFEARVNKAFAGHKLKQHEFDAAVDFDFNTGGIHRASWVKHFKNGDRAAARKAFMLWNKPKEIIRRREKGRDLFFDGKYSSNGMVSTFPADARGRVQWGAGKKVRFTSRPVSPNAPPHDPAMDDGMLVRGERGPAVGQLQKDLMKLGFYKSPPDLNFGPATQKAVEDFQASVGLKVDGKAGPKTFAAVNEKVGRNKGRSAIGAIINIIARLFRRA